MPKDNVSLLHAPIDQYGRYYLVTSAIRELMKQKHQKTIKVLDIGGYKGLTKTFFADEDVTVTVVDLYDSKDKDYVKASALALPFEDDSFDYVVTFEVLEHIPREHRKKFISEALRVSSGSLLLTAPFAGRNEEVAKTEVLVNDFWRGMYRQNHPWLEEHIDNKIPIEQEVERIVSSYKLPFKKIGNNNIVNWNTMVTFNFFTTLFRPSGENDAVHDFYNKHMNVLEANADTYYRQIYLIGEDAKRTLKAWDHPKVSPDEQIHVQNELINKVFTTMARDVIAMKKKHDAELLKISKELEQRIKSHDRLVEEVDTLQQHLNAANEFLPLRMRNELIKRIRK